MTCSRNIFLYGVCLFIAHVTGADVMVQLNINRPINDVSDKFVSFTMKPEDLYEALDSSNRKTITRMASMLSHSHVKFVGDYYFAAKTEGIRLRNPTKIVWKGFNKWTKAVNWSMIIPVPYKPDNWDPMETLKILNTSQMVDIDEVIWQLGTDFGTARAADYVSELKTFNIMVDSFKHAVINWQAMGADISAGSSPEETRRYIEMSRDLNAAYGWIQSDDLFSSNSVSSPLEGQDPALKVLFRSKVPVWLTLPRKKALSMHMEDEVMDGLQWAQTMGEAAHIGFDSIFKPFTLEDMERPKYSFFVTALFKKIMGSRVYPARPLPLYNRHIKLYTHCASMVSGGLALMLINPQEQSLQITIRPMSKIQDTEVWQYTLTMYNGQVMLNNNKVFINSTLAAEVRRRNTKSMLQLRTPAMSVSFWVLPNANLEHCHFTEVQTPIVPEEFNQKIKRYSSSDRLLKELIKETAKQPSFRPLAGLLNRHRRSLDKDDRQKRFVLEGSKDEQKPLSNLAENFVQEIKNPLKRDVFSPERRKTAIDWLTNIFKEPLNLDLPLLKRNVRQSGPHKGPFFMTRDGKKTTFTKKITEIKKPEKKVKKIVQEEQEFDEEKFFKTTEEQPEPEYVRIPEGDVFLSHIASVNGEDAEAEELPIETKKTKKAAEPETDEIVSEMKPLRLLPTEFFEAYPAKPAPPTKPIFGTSANSLFSDPFGKKLKSKASAKNKEKVTDDETDNNEEDNILKSEIDMTSKILKSRAASVEEEETPGTENKHILETDEDNTLGHGKSEDNLNFYADDLKAEKDNLMENEDKTEHTESFNGEKFDEIPWWDVSAKRLKRSLEMFGSGNSWHDNMISKEHDPMVAANELTPTSLRQFENKVNEVVGGANENSVGEESDDFIFGKKVVKTFKEQVTKFVDLFSHHANEWYNTFTKQFEVLDNNSTTVEGNRVA